MAHSPRHLPPPLRWPGPSLPSSGLSPPIRWPITPILSTKWQISPSTTALALSWPGLWILLWASATPIPQVGHLCRDPASSQSPGDGLQRLPTTRKFILMSHYCPWNNFVTPIGLCLLLEELSLCAASMGLLASHNIQDNFTPISDYAT
jgi:hypothetical protein